VARELPSETTTGNILQDREAGVPYSPVTSRDGKSLKSDSSTVAHLPV